VGTLTTREFLEEKDSMRFIELHKEHWKGSEGETEVRQVIQVPGSGSGASGVHG
jgi:hypothetical protein